MATDHYVCIKRKQNTRTCTPEGAHVQKTRNKQNNIYRSMEDIYHPPPTVHKHAVYGRMTVHRYPHLLVNAHVKIEAVRAHCSVRQAWKFVLETQKGIMRVWQPSQRVPIYNLWGTPHHKDSHQDFPPWKNVCHVPKSSSSLAGHSEYHCGFKIVDKSHWEPAAKE